MQDPVGLAPRPGLGGVVDLAFLQCLGPTSPPPVLVADGVHDAFAPDLAGHRGIIMKQEDPPGAACKIMPGKEVTERRVCPDGRGHAPAGLALCRCRHTQARSGWMRVTPRYAETGLGPEGWHSKQRKGASGSGGGI